MVAATARIQLRALEKHIEQEYTNEMDTVAGPSMPNVSKSILQQKNAEVSRALLAHFDAQRLVGVAEAERGELRASIENKLKDRYVMWSCRRIKCDGVTPLLINPRRKRRESLSRCYFLMLPLILPVECVRLC